MPNDTAIVRLLYSILSQKCLKDIDWNKVAEHPILNKEVTNGHAARMRYSRFKKQMDGTAGVVRRPRNPNSPRKNRVEKNKGASKDKHRRSFKNEEDEDDDMRKVKVEHPEMEDFDAEGEEAAIGMGEIKIKTESRDRERESSYMPSTPFTPHSQISTPGSIRSHSRHGFGEVPGIHDSMMHSFEVPSPTVDGMYAPMMGEAYGLMHMGMSDPFDNMWTSSTSVPIVRHSKPVQGQVVDEEQGEVSVKAEPRWDEAYQHV